MNDPAFDKRISVIILTINQRQQTLRCIEKLQQSRSSDQSFHITVWDNGSNDGTVEAIHALDPNVTVLRSDTNLGVAGGRNAAAKAAIDTESPDILLFLDNDMVVEEDFVKALTDPFSGENGTSIGQTQAKLLLSDDPERINDGGGCNVQFWLGRSRPVGYGEMDHGQFDDEQNSFSNPTRQPERLAGWRLRWCCQLLQYRPGDRSGCHHRHGSVPAEAGDRRLPDRLAGSGRVALAGLISSAPDTLTCLAPDHRLQQ